MENLIRFAKLSLFVNLALFVFVFLLTLNGFAIMGKPLTATGKRCPESAVYGHSFCRKHVSEDDKANYNDKSKPVKCARRPFRETYVVTPDNLSLGKSNDEDNPHVVFVILQGM